MVLTVFNFSCVHIFLSRSDCALVEGGRAGIAGRQRPVPLFAVRATKEVRARNNNINKLGIE